MAYEFKNFRPSAYKNPDDLFTYAGQGQKNRAARGLDALEDFYSPW